MTGKVCVVVMAGKARVMVVVTTGKVCVVVMAGNVWVLVAGYYRHQKRSALSFGGRLELIIIYHLIFVLLQVTQWLILLSDNFHRLLFQYCNHYRNLRKNIILQPE